MLLMRAVSQVLLLGLDLVRDRTGPDSECTVFPNSLAAATKQGFYYYYYNFKAET